MSDSQQCSTTGAKRQTTNDGSEPSTKRARRGEEREDQKSTIIKPTANPQSFFFSYLDKNPRPWNEESMFDEEERRKVADAVLTFFKSNENSLSWVEQRQRIWDAEVIQRMSEVLMAKERLTTLEAQIEASRRSLHSKFQDVVMAIEHQPARYYLQLVQASVEELISSGETIVARGIALSIAKRLAREPSLIIQLDVDTSLVNLVDEIGLQLSLDDAHQDDGTEDNEVDGSEQTFREGPWAEEQDEIQDL